MNSSANVNVKRVGQRCELRPIVINILNSDFSIAGETPDLNFP